MEQHGKKLFPGCTDPYAENYNENAYMDDGSCTYPDNRNYSLSFDGVDDMIQIPDNDLYDFVNEFSIGFKFKPSLEFDGGWLATKGWDGHGQTNRIWSLAPIMIEVIITLSSLHPKEYTNLMFLLAFQLMNGMHCLLLMMVIL